MRYPLLLILFVFFISSCSQPYPDIKDETVRKQFLDNGYENLALLYAADGELCYIGQKVDRPSVLRLVWVLDNAKLKSFPVNKDLTLLRFTTSDKSTIDLRTKNSRIAVASQNETQAYLIYDGFIPNNTLENYSSAIKEFSKIYFASKDEGVITDTHIVGNTNYFRDNPPSSLPESFLEQNPTKRALLDVDELVDGKVYERYTNLPFPIELDSFLAIIKDRDDLVFRNKTNEGSYFKVGDNYGGAFDSYILTKAGKTDSNIVIFMYEYYEIGLNQDTTFTNTVFDKVVNELQEELNMIPNDYMVDTLGGNDTTKVRFARDGIRYYVSKDGPIVSVVQTPLSLDKKRLLAVKDSIAALPQ